MGVAVQTVSAWINDPDGSRLRARKDSYRGECAECGGPTCGGDGPTNTPMLCAACVQWTDEQIIDAIRAWAEGHGGIPPKQIDWRWAPPTDHIPREVRRQTPGLERSDPPRRFQRAV